MDGKELRRISAKLAAGLVAAGKTSDKDIEKAISVYRQVAAHFSDEEDEERQRARAAVEEKRAERPRSQREIRQRPK